MSMPETAGLDHATPPKLSYEVVEVIPGLLIAGKYLDRLRAYYGELDPDLETAGVTVAVALDLVKAVHERQEGLRPKRPKKAAG